MAGWAIHGHYAVATDGDRAHPPIGDTHQEFIGQSGLHGASDEATDLSA